MYSIIEFVFNSNIVYLIYKCHTFFYVYFQMYKHYFLSYIWHFIVRMNLNFNASFTWKDWFTQSR